MLGALNVTKKYTTVGGKSIFKTILFYCPLSLFQKIIPRSKLAEESSISNLFYKMIQESFKFKLNLN